MTAFVRSEFTPGEYVMYQGRFVARFKRGHRASFLSFLAKNFTVEEYFARLEAGDAPLTILESKGYILPHIRAFLKEQGLPVNREGYKRLIARQIADVTASF